MSLPAESLDGFECEISEEDMPQKDVSHLISDKDIDACIKIMYTAQTRRKFNNQRRR